MRILVINLERSPERLARMQTILLRAGLNFDRVAAIDGREMSEEERLSWTDPGSGPLYPGEIACFLSHRKCWSEIADGENHAIILEDDVHLGDRFVDFASDGDWIPLDADIVKLETRLGRETVIDRRARPVIDRKLARLRGRNICSAAYIVTKKAAAELLTSSQTIGLPVDRFLFDPVSPMFHKLRTYQLVPAVCTQDRFIPEALQSPGLESTLEPEYSQRVEQKTIWTKITRELSRPLKRVASAVQNTALARRRGPIPFR